MVKNPPAMQETQVWSLGQDSSLKKGMATHSALLAWRIPWAEQPGGLHSIGSQRVRHDWATNTSNDVGLNAQGLILRGKRAWFKLECRVWSKPLFIQRAKLFEKKPKTVAYGCRLTDDIFFLFTFYFSIFGFFFSSVSMHYFKKKFILLHQISVLACGIFVAL